MRTAILLLTLTLLVTAAGRAAEPRAGDFAAAAHELYKRGDLRGALTGYAKAIALKQTSAEYYLRRGRIKAQMGRFDDAAVDLTIAVTFDPNLAEAWRQLSSVCLELDRFERADHAATRSVLTDGTNAASWSRRGHACAALGKYDAALQACDQAVELQPHDPNLLRQRAWALAAAGDMKEAVVVFSAALKAEPENPQDLCARATIFLLQASRDRPVAADLQAQAGRDLRQALKKEPNAPETHTALALHAVLAKKPQDLVAHLRRAAANTHNRRAQQLLALRSWACLTLLHRPRLAGEFLPPADAPSVPTTPRARLTAMLHRDTLPARLPEMGAGARHQLELAAYGGIKALLVRDRVRARYLLERASRSAHRDRKSVV